VANDVTIISNESLIVSSGDKSSRIGGGTFALIISLLLKAFLFLPNVGVCTDAFCFCFNDCLGVVFGRIQGGSRREHKKHINPSLLLPLAEAQLLEKYDTDDAITCCDV
jgi:hypothetical protein